MREMRERWDNLALREKQMLILGAVVVGVLLIYLLIWTPLINKNENLREQIHQNQALLAWMQDADKRIRLIEKTASKNPPVHTTGSLLGLVQKQLNLSPLVSSLTQLHQVENNAVQLTFQKVDFDKMMAWLIQMARQHELIVSQMSVTPTTTPGMVSIELVLKTANSG